MQHGLFLASQCPQHRPAPLHPPLEQIQKRIREQEERSPGGSGASPGAAAGAVTFDHGSSAESLPAAWDEQEPLPAPGQQHHHHHRQLQQLQQDLPHHHHHHQQQQWYSAAREESEEAEQEKVGERRQQRRWRRNQLALSSPSTSDDSRLGSPSSSRGSRQWPERSGSGSDIVMAVSNPLFGSSRPSTAQGSRPASAQGVHDMVAPQAALGRNMLPPKRSLRRQSSSQGESGGPQQQQQQQQRQWDPRASSRSLASAAAAAAQKRRQRQHSPQLSSGLLQSLGSLGSGWGGEEGSWAVGNSGLLPVHALSAVSQPCSVSTHPCPSLLPVCSAGA